MPCVLEVRLRHDRHVAEARRGGRGDADAGDLPDEDGKQQTGCSPSEIPPSHHRLRPMTGSPANLMSLVGMSDADR